MQRLSEKQALFEKMRRQIEVLTAFSQKMYQMREYLMHKDWAGLETAMWKLKLLSKELEHIEEERRKLFSAWCKKLGIGEHATFYEVLSRIDPEEHRPWIALYRDMKTAALKVKTASSFMDSYARSASAVISEILGEMYPFRKGRIYSPKGISKPIDQNPLIVNAHF